MPPGETSGARWSVRWPSGTDRWAQALIGLWVLVYLIWQLRPNSLGVFAYLYDEGVYLQTAVALMHGHDLYEEIFSSQPPLLPALLAGLFEVIGPSLEAARVLVIGLSLAGLLGVASLARAAGGWRASLGALALLVVSPHFLLTARQVTPEVPALALATLALALAVPTRGQVWWRLAAGLLLALATFTKLSALVVAPSLILLIAWPRVHQTWRTVLRDLLLVSLPALLLWSLLALQFDPEAIYGQLVQYREAARTIYRLNVGANLRMVLAAARDQPTGVLLAGLGILALVWRREWHWLAVIGSWLGVTLVATLTITPLFDHHLVLLVPPVAVLAGSGLEAGMRVVTRLRHDPRPSRRTLLASLLSVLALSGAILLMPVAIRAILEDEPDMAASWESPDDAVAALQALPDDIEVILSDEPMLVFAANREVPPWFVDTSRVRIGAGWLSRGQLTRYIQRERPGAILFWSGRFGRIPGFREWVGQYYRLAETFASDQELYVRADS